LNSPNDQYLKDKRALALMRKENEFKEGIDEIQL
jgi:hypothetical protein